MIQADWPLIGCTWRRARTADVDSAARRSLQQEGRLVRRAEGQVDAHLLAALRQAAHDQLLPITLDGERHTVLSARRLGERRLLQQQHTAGLHLDLSALATGVDHSTVKTAHVVLIGHLVRTHVRRCLGRSGRGVSSGPRVAIAPLSRTPGQNR